VIVLDSPRAVWPSGFEVTAPAEADRVPPLVPGVSLHELDSSAVDQAYLLKLPGGRTFQLAGPLYHLIALLDGQRTYVEVAAALGERIGRTVTADEVHSIVARKLAPLGILAPDLEPLAGPSFGPPLLPAEPAPDAALGILGRLSLVPASRLERVTDVAKHLYHPVVAVPILALVALAHVYAYQQLGPSLAHLTPFSLPVAAFLLGLLLIQLVIPWHELGHGAAVRYFGARHGSMGVGLMGISVVAFVDVSDIWRLPRWKRLVVDLGGLYFQSMAIALLALWAWATGDPTALWVVLLMDFAMLFNLNPLFKLDGYWAASDATGIPNLHQRVGDQLGQVAARILRSVARVVRFRPVLASPRLERMAAHSEALGRFGGRARLGLALYCGFFVLSALQFIFMTVTFLPVMVLSYPFMLLFTVNAVIGLLTQSIDPGFGAMILIQFFFTTLLLLGLGSMLWTLLQNLRRRRRGPVPADAAWRM
jgi:hypothetical protein